MPLVDARPGGIRVALRCLVPTVILAAGVILLELTFGSWLRSNPWERAFAINVVAGRTYVFDVSHLYEGGGHVIYSRDRYGLRGNYGSTAAINALTLGGSTTEQRYIPDGRTWQDVLQRQLRAAGKPAVIANAGISGHTTFGHLASYDYWFPLIPDLRPRYTVLYVGINDFMTDAPTLPADGPDDGTVTLKNKLKANSIFFRVLAKARDLYGGRARTWGTRVDSGALPHTETPILRDHEAVGRPFAAAFEGRFIRLLGRILEQKSVPVCVTQPTALYRVEPDGRILGVDLDVSSEGTVSPGAMNGVDYFHLRHMLDQVMIRSCGAVGAPTIDLAMAQWDPSDFYDFNHMTPAGTEKVGRRIASVMETLEW